MYLTNCYDCDYRRSIPGDVHSACIHPAITVADRALAPLFMANDQRRGAALLLNVVGNGYGIKNGWFMWPVNFDPVWLKSCNGFKLKETP